MKVLENKMLPQIKGKLNARSESGMFDCEPHLHLAAGIVAAAVTDWRELVKRKAWDKKPQRYCNFTELRLFFKSEWCAFLLQHFSIEPESILERLEAELAEAMRKEEDQ